MKYQFSRIKLISRFHKLNPLELEVERGQTLMQQNNFSSEAECTVTSRVLVEQKAI